jgi:hypothetical protein
MRSKPLRISFYLATPRYKSHTMSHGIATRLPQIKASETAVSAKGARKLHCAGSVANCIPVVKGWNYTVRLYRARQEIVDGRWKFPEPEPVK